MKPVSTRISDNSQYAPVKSGFALSVEVDPLECVKVVSALELDLLAKRANLGTYPLDFRIRREWRTEGISTFNK